MENETTCNSHSTDSYVYQRLNFKAKLLNEKQQRECALAMKHADVWYAIAEEKLPLGLILKDEDEDEDEDEDDAIFVPFFKEKFARMISTTLRSRALRLYGRCVEPKGERISKDEWINPNPMIVIGTCFNIHDQVFETKFSNAFSVLSTHKSSSSRCSDDYLLTSCLAQALVDQIHAEWNEFWPSDFMQNYLFRLSPTLQSFWIDPSLVYQGNQVIDLYNVLSFKTQSYKEY